jgi:hypothetical protein
MISTALEPSQAYETMLEDRAELVPDQPVVDVEGVVDDGRF